MLRDEIKKPFAALEAAIKDFGPEAVRTRYEDEIAQLVAWAKAADYKIPSWAQSGDDQTSSTSKQSFEPPDDRYDDWFYESFEEFEYVMSVD